jgi:hypothetical protein
VPTIETVNDSFTKCNTICKYIFVDNLAAIVGSLWIDCGQWQLTGGAIAGLIVDNVDNSI